ncbi:MAG: (d)CMP kinase [Betaproteobacteria bacterium]|nr:(d)CMP kinase [Betaproteobacteria bacterium]
MSKKPFIITIDGPAGAGKGTISKLVSQNMGFHYLDSGAIYRVIAFEANQKGLATDQISQITELIHEINIQFIGDKIFLTDKDVSELIRSEDIGKFASEIAKNEEIRKNILEFQKSFFKPPGLVADGRDMGTVIFPKAKVKIFLTASIQERANRRYKQLILKEKDVNLTDLFQRIKLRDESDKNRKISPLKAANDAYLVKTDNLSIKQSYEKVMEIIKSKVDR